MSSKALFKKVAVVGVGQIGGSLAWAIRKRGLARLVVGVAKRSHLDAKKIGAIDQGYYPNELKQALSGADLVILALPVSLNEDFMRQTAKTKLIDPNAVVIDVGSTKSRIARIAAKSPLKNRFIGCHPMAGSEKSGAANANPNLFEGALCFIARRHPRVERLWKGVGAEPIVMDARSHDAWVAHASHLPHLLAFLLFAGFPLVKGKRLRANPSIRDLVRIAKSTPRLWAEIFESNRAELISASRGLESRLKQFNQALQKHDSRSIERLVRESNQRAERVFPSHEKNR